MVISVFSTAELIRATAAAYVCIRAGVCVRGCACVFVRVWIDGLWS